MSSSDRRDESSGAANAPLPQELVQTPVAPLAASAAPPTSSSNSVTAPAMLAAEKASATVPQTRSSNTAMVPYTRTVLRTRAAPALGDAGALMMLNPTTRRVAVSVGKAGISIADGLLVSANTLMNPVLAAAFVAYQSAQTVQAYRHGELNRLGYRMTKGDVALRIGKDLTVMGLAVAVGQGVGALIGLSAIPVVGQVIVGTLLSVGLGICVGTLVTHYVDRFTARLQLRNQYGYPSDERGSRRRFEVLLERRHDLTTMESCRIVQHYADYRVACGWESVNELDDYRATGDITRMPVSLQHFAVVQLQRKWGFVKDRGQCRQIYRALLLVHHPDRGGSTEMTARLNKDFEFFAYCQGWDSDCAALLRSSGEAAGEGGGAASSGDGEAGRASRGGFGGAIVDYLRSLFHQDTNSQVGANDLHQFGLLTLEAGSPAELHRLDVNASLPSSPRAGGVPRRASALNNSSLLLDEPQDNPGEESGDAESDVTVTAAVRQRSVTHVLHGLHETYAATSELITFAGLIRVSDDPATWERLHDDVNLFYRLQYFIAVHTLGAVSSAESPSYQPPPPQQHSYHGFRWSTVEEAVMRREEARRAIIATVFTEETSQQLTYLLDLWRTAKAVAESYFRVCQQRDAGALGPAAAASHADEGRQTLDALLRIHKQLDAVATAARGSWHGRLEDWATRTAPGFSSFMEDVKEVGLAASNALAAEYVIHALPSEQDQCLEYGKTWSRKQDTLRTLLSELQLAYDEHAIEATEDLARRLEEYQSQLILLHKQMAVVDVGIAEWVNACSTHFPELTPTLRLLPSTALMAVGPPNVVEAATAAPPSPVPASPQPRFASFERERTLLHYSRLERKPTNPFDPFASRASFSAIASPDARRITMVDEDDSAETLLTSFKLDPQIDDAVVSPDGVGMVLLQAMYSDPLTGEIMPCWLKRYSFPATVSTQAAAAAVQRAARRILAEEVSVSARCSRDCIVSVRDVFYHYDRRELFLHYGRGATQQRFCSVNDVRRQVEPLGLRWLHNVLECVLCLHSCQLAHGHIRLSSFTYDDFGNTALGVFSPAWDGTNAVADSPKRAEKGAARTAAPLSLAERQYCDVVDLGIMLLAEVLPLFLPAKKTASATPTMPTSMDEMATVMEAVAEHLIGKAEPRWSVHEARQFVRRSLQVRLVDIAVLSKQVVHPASWAMRGPVPPVQLVVADAAHFTFAAIPSTATVRVYQNRHLSLWETYWRCRRKMAALCKGNYIVPLAVAKYPAPLLCNDDLEVQERYVWATCDSEEDAWERCQDGFRCVRRHTQPLPPSKDMIDFDLTAPQPSPHGKTIWGVVCRAALGTTLEETQEEYESVESLADVSTTQYNKLSYAAERRSHFVPQASPDSAPSRIWLPCPWARCYPEYVVQITF